MKQSKKHIKKLVSIILALTLAMSISIPGFAAEDDDCVWCEYAFDNSPEGREAAAEMYNVSVDTVARRFSAGIPDFLSDEQVTAILAGEGLEVEYNNCVFSYASEDEENENNPKARLVTSTANLSTSHTWAKDYSTLTFNYRSYSYQPKQVKTHYRIGDQDKSSSSLAGRAWCAIKTPSRADIFQATSETITGITSKYVEASRYSDDLASGTVTQYVQYAYRNLNTDWNRSYKYNHG